MPLLARLAIAFVLSFLAAGAVQQFLMAAAQLHDPRPGLLPLAVLIVIVSAVFAIAARKWAAWRVAAALLALIVAIGTAGMVFGLANWSPEVGGDIVYGLAQLIDLYMLLPCGVAILVHWLLLRGVVRKA